MSETDNIQFQKPKTFKSVIRKIATAVIVVFLILAILWPVVIHMRESTHRRICAQHLRRLEIAMLIYDGGDGEIRPTAEKWCDLAIKFVEIKPEEFVCPRSDAKIGESSYATNINVADKKNSEFSRNTISFFETYFGKSPSGRQELLQNREWYKALRPKGYYRSNWAKEWVKKYRASEKVYKLRWNQVGGLELVTFENHKGQGCNVVFHDLHIEFVKPEQLGELDWEDK